MRPIEHTLDTGDISLNYGESEATGPSLLLLHGIAARWQTMAPLIPALSSTWHIFAPDLRGHGKSGRAGERYRLDDFAADAVALVTARADPPVAIYGHSLGGWIALTVAAEHPELVRGIVVADSAIYPTADVPESAISYLGDGLPIAMRAMAQSHNQLDPDVLTALRDGRLTHRYQPESLLPRVTCPVLLLQANPDLGGLMTDNDVEAALGLLPRATHVRFGDLDHGLHVRDARQVLDAVVPFLDAINRSEAPSQPSARGDSGPP
jgi:pimeloyl-ACP methyl ester carboxylesterase